MDNDFAGINAISEGLLACGVTSFLPTTLTAPIELINQVVETIGQHYQKVTGAKIQGIYLEGPFLQKNIKGHKILTISLILIYRFLKSGNSYLEDLLKKLL